MTSAVSETNGALACNLVARNLVARNLSRFVLFVAFFAAVGADAQRYRLRSQALGFESI